MLTLSEYLQRLEHSDNSLVFLVGLIAACVILTVYLHNQVPRFRTAARALSVALIPLLTLILNIPAGATALIAAFIASRRFPELPDRVWARITLPLIIALVIGLLLRVPRMAESYWYDEAFTYRIANLPLEHLPDGIAHDTHPPLFYVLTWVWARIPVPHSEVWMRLPSLALGLLGIVLMHRLIVRVMTSWAFWKWTKGTEEINYHEKERRTLLVLRVAAVGAFLIAVMPAHIYYSVELRPYALLTVLVFTALLSIFETRPRLLALMLALIPLTHNLGWFYSGVIALITVVVYGKRLFSPTFFSINMLMIRFKGLQKREMIIAAIIGALVPLLWIPVLIYQAAKVGDGFWMTYAPGRTFTLLYFDLGVVEDRYILLTVVPFIALFMLSLWTARKALLQPAGLIISAVGIGVVSLVSFTSAVWSPIFLARPLLPAALLMIIPIAFAASVPESRRAMRGLLAPVLLISLISFYSPFQQRADYKSEISAACDGVDRFYATAIHTAFIAAPHWNGEMLLWDGAEDNGQTFQIEEMEIYGFERVSHEDMRGERVCMMFIDSPYTMQNERTYLAQLLDGIDPVRVEKVNRMQHLYFYQVTIP